MKLIKNFLRGIMNKDFDERLLPDGQYRDALNIEVSASEGAGVGAVENIKGNTNVTNYGFTAAAKTIGAITDDSNSLIYWLVVDTSFDYVMRYNELLGITTVMLKDTKGRVLKFNSTYLVTGINIINDLLFWTDDLNPPRRLNVKKYYATDGFSEQDISVILAPPLLAPTLVLSTSTTGAQDDDNTMEESFLRFAYRYKYENDEYSSISPFSATAFLPSVFDYDYGDGDFTSMLNQYNIVNITFNTGAAQVKEVQLLFMESNSSNLNVIDSYDKLELGWADNASESIEFDNNKIYTVLPNDEITRLFDNVPLKAKAQELIGSRIAYGNYVQFYNIADADGSPIYINYELSVLDTAVTGQPLPTFRSDRDYEVGIAYLDNNGRMTTVLISEANTLYIPPTLAATGNDIRVTINHFPPSFADKYRIFIKQNKGDYYNIFPMYYYVDGVFIWFAINPSEVDKFKVGDYIILKSRDGVQSGSDFKYKVIDLVVQDKNFLDNSNTQLPGLYFKIKSQGFTFGSIFSASYAARGVSFNQHQNNSVPFINGTKYNVIDFPIFYGQGESSLTISSNSVGVSLPKDIRFKILMVTSSTFKYYIFDGQGYSGVAGFGVALSISGLTTLYSSGAVVGAPGSAIAYITFGGTGYTAGDYWIINVHGGQRTIGNVVLNVGAYSPYAHAVFPDETWFPSGSALINTGVTSVDVADRQIKAGAVITLAIRDQDSSQSIGNTATTPAMTFSPSPRTYQNIEEWFYESGAYIDFHHISPLTGTDMGDANVFFIRGTNWRMQPIHNSATNVIDQGISTTVPATYATWQSYLATEAPVRMCIQGMGKYRSSGGARAFLYVDMTIIQQEDATVFETEGDDNNTEIYHETSTFDIDDGIHYANIQNQGVVAGSQPAIVSLNDLSTNSNYNAYAFGNGVEGLRIRGAFNKPQLKLSPRVSAVIEDYKQQRVEEAITYSGVYRENTGINNLNEFNLSLANFKYIDKFFGSIQKLHARDTDLIAFQEDKVSRILYGKNLLSDAAGGGLIASIPEVLGTQNTFAGEYGISQNPESFATWGTSMYFTDSRRGAVMKLGGNGMGEISAYGMKNWFKDLFQTNLTTQKLGAIDPFKERYVLANNDIPFPPCVFEVSLDPDGLSVWNQPANTYINVTASGQWVATLINTGDLTNWATINGQATTYTGQNNEVVVVSTLLNAGASRSMRIQFVACGTTYTYTIKQSSDRIVTTKRFAIGNTEDTGLITDPIYDFTSNAGADITFPNTKLTTATVAMDTSYRNFEGLQAVPTAGDTVDLKASELGTPTQKPFSPNLGNQLLYLVTDTLYTANDIDTILSLATATVPALAAGVYTGSFVYNRPASEAYLYMVWDYRNNVDAGDTITMPTGNTGDSTTVINYGTRRGRVSIAYNANVLANTFTLKYNGQVVDETVLVAGAGTLTFLKSLETPSQLELIVGTGGADDGWSAVTAATTLTSFLIDINNDTLATVCARVPATTYYHDGAVAFPTIGDRIFQTSSGEGPYDGGNALHKIGAGNDYVGVNNGGVVITEGDCAACAEVAIPVISTANFTITQGDDIALILTTTLNPTEFAIISTCNSYTLAGGTDGAVFSSVDCETGDTITTIASAASEQIICASALPTVTSGTGTVTLVGVCEDFALPPGLTFNTFTGTIGGTAEKTGVYTVTFTATNCFGTSINTNVIITVAMPTENPRFNMDTANPSASSALACAAIPTYGIMYHDGENTYPVVNDFIYDYCGCELQAYNGGYLWYLTDELTGVKNNVIRVDSIGQVVEKVVCP